MKNYPRVEAQGLTQGERLERAREVVAKVLGKKAKRKLATLARDIKDGQVLPGTDHRPLRQFNAHPSVLALREELVYVIFGVLDPAQVLGLSAADGEHLARYGLNLFASDDFEHARAAAALALAANPDCFEACVLMGCVLARAKEERAALGHYLRAQELRPSQVRPWVDSGELRIGLGEYTQAAADLKRAIELDPRGETPAGRRAQTIVVRTLMSVS
jgi:tetratricopeptide (TPR) repeat protein